jgi:hypothetical protein
MGSGEIRRYCRSIEQRSRLRQVADSIRIEEKPRRKAGASFVAARGHASFDPGQNEPGGPLFLVHLRKVIPGPGYAWRERRDATTAFRIDDLIADALLLSGRVINADTTHQVLTPKTYDQLQLLYLPGAGLTDGNQSSVGAPLREPRGRVNHGEAQCLATTSSS